MRAKHVRPEAICLAVLSTAAVTSAVGCEQYSCQPVIDAGRASKTLQEFSRQTGFQLFFDDSVRGHHTNAADGHHPAIKALEEMLEGNGLKYSFLDKDTITVAAIPLDSRASRPISLEQVVVRGVGSNEEPLVNMGIQLDAATLASTSLDTIQDILRAYPQISGGVCDSDFDTSRIALTNSTLGCGVNFRGLGPDMTVVLINGKPIAASGTGALFVDVSHIPLSAIDRVELFPDDASLLYGADAIGGTANFIMRREFDGVELQVRSSPGWGSATSENLLSLTLGKIWDFGSLQISFEDYRRSALLAAARAQGTSNLTRFGGSNYDSLLGDPGTVYNGATLWAIPTFRPGATPIAADFTEGTYNLHDIRQGTDLLPMQSHISAYIAGTLNLTDDEKLDLDALVTRRSVADAGTAVGIPITINSGNPYYFNPSGTTAPVNIYYGFGNALGPTILHNDVLDGDFTLGFTRTLFGDWRLSAYLGYSWESQDETVWNLINPYNLTEALASTASAATAFDPFVPGMTTRAVLQNISSHSQFSSDSGLRMGSVTTTGGVDGPLGGVVTVRVGAQYRGDSLATLEQAGDYSVPAYTNSQRTMFAGFTDLCTPIAGAATDTCVSQRKTGESSLQLSAAGRYEHYSDVGGKAVPAVSLYWATIAGLSFEANFRRAFKVPSLADLNESHNSSEIVPLANSAPASGYSNVLVWSGSNANLRPETGRTWTLSATMRPASGWTFNFLYYDVDNRNRIEQPALDADALTSESGGQIVTIAPSTQQRAAVCARSQFSGNPADCMNAPIYALVDTRLNNLSRVTTDGFDLTGRRDFGSDYRKWSIGATGTYILSYWVTQPSGNHNIIDSPGNPLQFQVRAFASLTLGSFGADLIAHFTDGYTDYVDQPTRNVRSLSTLDGQLTWRLARGKGGSCRTSISLSAQNIFGVNPPFVNNSIGLGYDPDNSSDRGRVVNLDFVECW